MTSSAGFPLFSLPFLVLQKTLDQFCLNEIVRIALCSRKSQRITTKMFTKTKTLWIGIYLESWIGIRYGTEESIFFVLDISELPNGVPFDIIKFDGIPVKSIKKPEKTQVDTFWKDKTLGIKAITKGFTRIFSSENCGKLDKFYIDYGFWMTLEDLSALNCKFIEIRKSNLTNTDINQFLKHWQNGGSSQTKFIQIQMNSCDLDSISSGMDVEEMPTDVTRSFLKFRSIRSIVSGGYDIKRIDGVIGTMIFDDENEPGKILFSFAVGLQEYKKPKKIFVEEK